MTRKLRFDTPPENIGEFCEADGIKDPEALAFYFSRKKQKVTEIPVNFPRASSLYSGCLRMHVFACKIGIKMVKKEYGSIRGALIFDFGNVAHRLAQDTPVLFGDSRVGLWKCSACGKKLYFGHPPTEKCPSCGARPAAIKYHEYGFSPTKDFYVSGHVDLFLDIGSNFLPRITDLKTMNQDDFEALSSPVAKDEFQVGTYMIKASQDSFLKNKVDTKNAYLCYVGKIAKARQMPMKMFRVPLSASLEKSIRERENIFRTSFLNYPQVLPPPVRDCVRGNKGTDFTSFVAKKCPALQFCKNFFNQGQ